MPFDQARTQWPKERKGMETKRIRIIIKKELRIGDMNMQLGVSKKEDFIVGD